MEEASSTWQVYCFGKRNVLRLNLKEYGKISFGEEGEGHSMYRGQRQKKCRDNSGKHIWVILLKTGQNCDIEGKNSKCEFVNAIIWE